VRPARPGEVIKSPADDSLPPNDVDFFLLGKTELTHKQAMKLTPEAERFAKAEDQPFTGHMLDLPKPMGVSNAEIH
jgi:pilus assembly protein CpaC